METTGYIKTNMGEILISHVQTFKDAEAFLKAHPELSAEIWTQCNPDKAKKPKKEKETPQADTPKAESPQDDMA